MSDDAEKNADELKHLLKRQGWCFLTVEALDGETIVVLRNTPPLRDFERSEMGKAVKRIKEKRGITDGIPCYTMSEFEILLDAPKPKLIHAVKKQGGMITGETIMEIRTDGEVGRS